MSANEANTDLQLLASYTHDRAEDAFAELVRRHVDLVHSAALRQVRSPQLAEEVAQSVFTDLARNAGRLKPDTVLTAWLYQVTRRTAIDVVRREARRQLREQIATEMNAMNATAADWTRIEPLLDEAVSALDEADRAAILLRYFENKSLRDVGATLGTSDDAAQKRVSRAVERLREFFVKRGVTVGASGLVALIAANAVQAAPVGLVLTISTAAFAGTAIATAATATATKAIAMTTLQKAIFAVTIVAVGVATPLVIQHQSNVSLREENQSLRQQIAQVAELQVENERLSNLLAQTNNVESRPNNELLRLRGEVGLLRRQTNEMGGLLEKSQRWQSSSATSSTGLQVVESASALSEELWSRTMDAIQSNVRKWSAKTKTDLVGHITSEFSRPTFFQINGFTESVEDEEVGLVIYIDQVKELRVIKLERIGGSWQVSGQSPAMRETTAQRSSSLH